MLRYKSPLRYPGGKAALAPLVAEVISRNGLADGNYAEPYCGGAGVALELVTGEIVRTIYLNDADPRIYAFWHSILYDTERFLRLLWDTPVNVSQWKRQKEIMVRSASDMLSTGFSTFYLNRCSRSGILSAGPIGGFRQNGKWGIDARFSKAELAKRINCLANYSNRITISNLDALVFLTNLEQNLRAVKKILIYLDPPYFSMGNRLYFNYYTHEDHEELANHMRSCNLKWILSYNDVFQIRRLYQGFPMKRANLIYHANIRKKGRELLVFHPDLDSSCIPM